LPQKFGIDKRKAHLSTLICSGQLSRQEALEKFEHSNYDKKLLASDKEFVLKKLGYSEKDFDKYIQAPRREHTEFKHEIGIWDDLPWTRPFKPAWKIIKKLRNK
jgi:hypothetical protein